MKTEQPNKLNKLKIAMDCGCVCHRSIEALEHDSLCCSVPNLSIILDDDSNEIFGDGDAGLALKKVRYPLIVIKDDGTSVDLDATIAQALREERERIVKAIKKVVEQGHGGGNWRRLLVVLLSKLEDKQ